MALNFDSAGTGRRVDHGSGATLDDLHAGAFTGWMWVHRTSDGNNQFLMSKDGTGTVGWLAAVVNGGGEGQVSVGINRATTDSSATTSSGMVPLNTDVFVAWVYDSGASQHVKVYIGTRFGQAVEATYSSTANGSGSAVSDAASSLYVGNYPASATLPFRGTISRGGLVARALSLHTLRYLQAQSSSEIANCNLSDTKLLFDYLDTSSVTDLSGNSNNGTVTSATNATHATLCTKYAVTNSDLYFSPYNWYSDGAGALAANNINGSSTFGLSNNPGAYVKWKPSASATSGMVYAVIETSHLSGVAAGDAPVLAVSVDGGAFTRTQIPIVSTDTKVAVPLTGVLASGSHTVELQFVSIGFGVTEDRWTTPEQSVKLLGIYMDSGTLSLATMTPKTKQILAYGDSITEGHKAIAAALTEASHDATASYVRHVAQALDAEYGIVAFAAQGIIEPGINGASVDADHPAMYSGTAANKSWDKYYKGKSRLVGGLFSPVPTWILIHAGVNDTGLTAAEVEDFVTDVQTGAPRAFIYVIGYLAASLSALAAGVLLVADTRKVASLTPTVIWTPGTAAEGALDGLHPNVRGHGLLASHILKLSRNTGPSMARIRNVS